VTTPAVAGRGKQRGGYRSAIHILCVEALKDGVHSLLQVVAFRNLGRVVVVVIRRSLEREEFREVLVRRVHERVEKVWCGGDAKGVFDQSSRLHWIGRQLVEERGRWLVVQLLQRLHPRQALALACESTGQDAGVMDECGVGRNELLVRLVLHVSEKLVCRLGQATPPPPRRALRPLSTTASDGDGPVESASRAAPRC
jgi:hypothetical protein